MMHGTEMPQQPTKKIQGRIRPRSCEASTKKLTTFGYDTGGAASGEATIEKLRHSSYDLRLLDYKLPDMTGREVVERLKGDSADPPFITIKAHGHQRTAVEMMKLGGPRLPS